MSKLSSQRLTPRRLRRALRRRWAQPVRSFLAFERRGREKAGPWIGLQPLESRVLYSADGTNLAWCADDLSLGNHHLPGACGCSMCCGSISVTPSEENPVYCALPVPDATLMLEAEATTLPDVGQQTIYTIPLDQTFNLHSRPGASKTVYLDFDGHVTTSSYWNNGATFTTPAYGFEGDASFSDNELLRIQAIWQRVAEDFAPFDVNVTTMDPGVEALRKSGSGDTQWGTRVVIGGNGSWHGGAGGVAYIGSFSWSTDTPSFVFEDNLANGHEKYTAEAITHEAGHTLSLVHDGTTGGTTYYAGHGSGDTGWAPIMGVGYYKTLTQWSGGEYSGANNTEDDLSLITTRHGFGYRADDAGNSLGSAVSLTLASGSLFGNGGIIERSTDVDFWAFSTGDGQANISITPASKGPNLDILATLYDSAGNTIATSNPDTLLSASFNLTLSAGTYYIGIDGVGRGDPANGGYSDYGSLGQYFFSGSFVEPNIVALEPEIDVRGNNVSITSGDTTPSATDGTDFGSADVDGGTVGRTFTIANTGDGALSLTGSPRITITGANAADFTVVTSPSGSVAAGGATTFQVLFNPSATGTRSATVTVTSDDADEGSYSFAVSGAGTQSVVTTVMDDEDAGFSQRGKWKEYNQNLAVNNDYYVAQASTKRSVANYRFQDVAAGTYEVFVSYISTSQRSTGVQYGVSDGVQVLGRPTLNQQLAPDDAVFDGKSWESLGQFTTSSSALSVTLRNCDTGSVSADAMRIVYVSPTDQQARSYQASPLSGRTLAAIAAHAGSAFAPAGASSLFSAFPTRSVADTLDTDSDDTPLTFLTPQAVREAMGY